MNLASADLRPVMASAPLVFHIAGQPGVRASFGDSFALYASDNIVATQRVFDAAAAAGCERVVWASSSSVYGDAATYPCVEATTPTLPRSPYGVTKRACEDLASVYRQQGLMTVGLRYFTVYGPRQRPDMAIRRICEALVSGAPFTLLRRRHPDPRHHLRARRRRGHRARRSGIGAVPDLQRRRRPRGVAQRGDRRSRRARWAHARDRTQHHAQAGDVRRTACGHDRGPEFPRMATSRGPCDGLGHALSWVEAEHAARVWRDHDRFPGIYHEGHVRTMELTEAVQRIVKHHLLLICALVVLGMCVPVALQSGEHATLSSHGEARHRSRRHDQRRRGDLAERRRPRDRHQPRPHRSGPGRGERGPGPHRGRRQPRRRRGARHLGRAGGIGDRS